MSVCVAVCLSVCLYGCVQPHLHADGFALARQGREVALEAVGLDDARIRRSIGAGGQLDHVANHQLSGRHCVHCAVANDLRSVWGHGFEAGHDGGGGAVLEVVHDARDEHHLQGAQSRAVTYTEKGYGSSGGLGGRGTSRVVEVICAGRHQSVAAAKR